MTDDGNDYMVMMMIQGRSEQFLILSGLPTTLFNDLNIDSEGICYSKLPINNKKQQQ